jgi:putative ABC transport system permease protein
LEALPGIEITSYSNNSFPGVNSTDAFKVKGKSGEYLAGDYWADWDQLQAMKFEMVHGRFFSRDFASDSSACVINEAAVKEFGFADPLSSEIIEIGNDNDTLRVVGVMKDFNFESLKSSIRPMIIRLIDVSRNLVVRYSGNPAEIVGMIEQQWKKAAPGEPFEYTFVDHDFDSLFRAEMRLRDLFIVFSSIAIFIACLGLFALAAFTTEQRTKEIGIRKALGATSIAVATLLSREFIRLVMIAVIPAVAIGWYGTGWWLANFAYRTEVSPFIFIGCGALAIAIAWLTVAYQAIKAASSNPVTALRYE